MLATTSAATSLCTPGDVEAGRPALGWTRPRFGSYCADKQTARAVSGIGEAACFMLGKDSSKLNVLNDSFAASCYLSFDGAQQRPAEDALLSTRRTLADAIVSHRRTRQERGSIRYRDSSWWELLLDLGHLNLGSC